MYIYSGWKKLYFWTRICFTSDVYLKILFGGANAALMVGKYFLITKLKKGEL